MSNSDLGEFNGNERFLIRRRLGSGGFGVVYQAYDRERNSIVALKTLSEGDADALYRFKREFRSLTDVLHPNLVALYELFSDRDQWFFTMEMVEGEDFVDYVRSADSDREQYDTQSREISANVTLSGEMLSEEIDTVSVSDIAGKSASAQPPAPSPAKIFPSKSAALKSAAPEILRFNENRLRSAMRQLVSGIASIHEAGKLHRDIKPSNVLVTKEGRVVILDYGLILEIAKKGAKQNTEIIGTPAYMSPEHAAGSPMTEASDWYSVGVMLYEILTGDLPFEGSAVRVLLEKQRFEPPPPRTLVESIPEDLNLLCSRLLSLDPANRPDGGEILHLLGEQPSKAAMFRISSSRLAVPLIGREKHLSSLNEAFGLAKGSGTVAVYVYGESGMGKSSLIRRFLEDLYETEPSAVMLAGRCYERESVPYKAVDSLIDSLSKYLMGLHKLEAETYLPRDVLALAKLFPVLRQVEAVEGSRRTVLDITDSLELRRRAFGALKELLGRIGDRRPLVLFIDDLQWGDVDSAVLIADLFSPPDPPSLLFLGSYRSEEADASPFLHTLFSRQSGKNSSYKIVQVAVEKFSPSEAKLLAGHLLKMEEISEEQSEAIARESGGNPLFIDELARYCRLNNGEVREAKLEEVICSRVAQLSDDARRLVEAVATAGGPIDKKTARKAAGLEVFDEKILGVLRSNHLIRSSGADEEKIETFHDRIRESIVKSLSPERLKQQHETLALALQDSGNADAETLMHHFKEASDLERAAAYAAKAADKAYEALAFDRAANLCKTAIELSQKLKADGRKPYTTEQSSVLRVKLADALANAGRGAEAAKEYLAAAKMTSGTEAAEHKRRAAEQFLITGHINDGVPLLREALQREGLKYPNTKRHAIAARLYWRLRLRLRGLNYKERDASAVSPAELAKIDACRSAAVGLYFVDSEKAGSFMTLHTILALDCGEPFRVIRALSAEAAYYSIFGEKNQKRSNEILHKISDLAERLNHPIATANSLFAYESVAYFRGRWKEAKEYGKQAEEIMRIHGTGLRWEMNQAQIYALNAHFYCGEVKELSNRLHGIIKEAQDRSDIYVEAYLKMLVLYRSLLAADKPDQADSEILEGIGKWENKGFDYLHWWCDLGRSAVALYRGDGLAAWRLINEHWAAFMRSIYSRIQLTFILSLHLHAYSAIAAAREQSQKEAMLRVAEKDAKKIERENMAWSNPIASAVRAGISVVRGDCKTALELLAKADSEFKAADMMLYAAAARRRRGELIGGDEGDNLIREADEWMSGQMIKNPARMTAIFIP